MTTKPLQGVWRDIVRDAPLSWRAKVVGYTLSTYMNGKGQAVWPSRQTIAAGASVTLRTVDKAIGELERAGLLLVSHSRGRSSNRYAATLPPTAHDVHGWEWANSAPGASNSAPGASNSARRAPESAESAESTSLKGKKPARAFGGPDTSYLDEVGL